MEKFTVLTARAALLMRANIDTDTIIPSEWMRSVTADLGMALFAGWRYTAEGTESPDFILNHPAFRDCGILVTGRNFGCGSSRENAVWALEAYGIRCVVAPSFSDTFTENCFKNGLLPVALDDVLIDQLAQEVETLAGRQPIRVDLVAQEIRTPGGWSARFKVDPHHRRGLIEGIDDIDRTLTFDRQIDAFQRVDQARRLWIYAPIIAPRDSSIPD